MRSTVYRSSPWRSSGSGHAPSAYYVASGHRDGWQRVAFALGWTLLSIGAALGVLFAAL